MMFCYLFEMNILYHSKRHHNIKTETVVRLAVKQMRVAYGVAQWLGRRSVAGGLSLIYA